MNNIHRFPEGVQNLLFNALKLTQLLVFYSRIDKSSILFHLKLKTLLLLRVETTGCIWVKFGLPTDSLQVKTTG